MMNNAGTKQKANQQDSFEEFLESLLLGIAQVVVCTGWLTLRLPAVSLPVICAVLAGLLVNLWVGLIAAAVTASVYAGWLYVDRQSFKRIIWLPMRDALIVWWRYERTWEQVAKLNGLAGRLNDQTAILPHLLASTVRTDSVDLTVKLAVGQCPADWQKRSDALAAAWKANKLVIRSGKPGQVLLTLHYGDALANLFRLPRPEHPDTGGLNACRIGLTEAGTYWTLPILGSHILIAGATGSGKGSVIWSVLAALAPAVKAGSVELHVVDPKGGMEFGRGERLFTRFAHDNGDETLDLLRSAVQTMKRRANALRGRTRLHVPTPTDPLILVIVDELASLTAYLGDRKVRAEVEQLLGLLLSQGRAVGVSVVAAVQDPSKEVLPIRQLFTIRIGLRMTESTQTTMVLGAAAREAGAVCDQISAGTPGVGYVLQDGFPEPFRVRAFHVDDHDIDYLADTFAPNRGGPLPSNEEKDV